MMESNKFYKNFTFNVNRWKKKIGRHFTLTEKIIFSHCKHDVQNFVRGKSCVVIHPDRIAMQDATAQMAMLQFISTKRESIAIPTSIHCDHLICAECNAREDLKKARKENSEIYDFLQSSSEKYGIDFWEPGMGIIHQTILENYAFPGGLLVGTDSHTPNGGGLGMIAIGVGGADAVEAMVDSTMEITFPKILGIKLTGKLKGWTSPKDVILYIAAMLKTTGGSGFVIEYFGEGAETISCTGKATICNMGAEVGATCSIFPLDKSMKLYLEAFGRKDIIDAIEDCGVDISADKGALESPEKYFDEFLEINLSELEPRINGPFSPDISHTISEFANFVNEQNFPEKLSFGLLGSCTNSSYEDMSLVVNIVEQLSKWGIKPKSSFAISPGSHIIYSMLNDRGYIKLLENLGGKVFANACGPCIGQWERTDVAKGEKNSIISSYNRNFVGRNDGNVNTHAFVASPAIVMAMVLGGKITFNPLQDCLIDKSGKQVMLHPPSNNGGLPKFTLKKRCCIKNPNKKIKIDDNSERLQLLKPFPKWEGNDYEQLKILIKIKGKCTTDHISPAGKWLKYRGHLENISKNFLCKALNAWTNEVGSCFDEEFKKVFSCQELAKIYKQKGIKWVIVADENYGEGSSREHAAMEARYLGCVAIIAKSFARIHEINVKRQGMLPLTFANPRDYDKIIQGDKISMQLVNFNHQNSLQVLLHHLNGECETLQLKHSFNLKQYNWFQTGSSINCINRF